MRLFLIDADNDVEIPSDTIINTDGKYLDGETALLINKTLIKIVRGSITAKVTFFDGVKVRIKQVNIAKNNVALRDAVAFYVREAVEHGNLLEIKKDCVTVKKPSILKSFINALGVFIR